MQKRTPEFDLLPAPAARTMAYAGVGSRRTPPDALAQMTRLAARLAARGYTLRSGGAQGADLAFEAGAGDLKEIFPGTAKAGPRELAVAREVHPSPPALDRARNPAFVWNLMARNTNQVFGRALDSPVDFVLCWTPDGIEHHLERTRDTGGTGQAIEMASRKGIPVINMNRPGWRDRLLLVIGPDGRHEERPARPPGN